MIGMINVVWLVGCLFLLTIKHFLMDYVLQTEYMLRKTNKSNWFMPLLVHATVHGVTSWLALLIPAILINQVAAITLLCLAEAVTHLLIDGTKSRLFHYSVLQPKYWVVHGVDQMMHTCVYIIMATFIALVVVR